MATLRKARWEAVADVPVRAKGQWGHTRYGAPERNRLTIGKRDGYVHRSFLRFEFDQSDIGILHKAELVMRVTAPDYSPGSRARVTVHRILGDWSEGDGTSWQRGDAVNPKVATNRTAYADLKDVAVGDEVRVDVTSLVGPWLKKTKRWKDGDVERNGWEKPRHGLRLKSKEDGGDPWDFSLQVWSREASDAANRPYLEISYEPPNYAPDLISTVAPVGTVLPGTDFSGEFGDPNGDHPAYIKVQVRKKSNQRVVWEPARSPFDLTWVDQGGTWLWTIENPGSGVLKANIDYEWRAKGWDSGEQDSGWTPWRGFRQEGTPSTVTLVPVGTLETLTAYEFRANWTTEPSVDIVSYRVQMKSASEPWLRTVWDHTFLPLTEREKSLGHILFLYGGPRLAAGTYDVRVQVVDSLGRSSTWSADEPMTLTIGSEQDQDQGGDFLPPNLTGFVRGRPRVRIVLRDVDGPNRGPGTVKAIIEDAHNIGFSSVVNEPGEMFFTLTSLHPQAGECEPFQRHYAVQQYRNGSWVDIHNGLLTDFDAGDNDIVIYGYDYLGILARSVDTRFPPPGTNIHAPHDKGGAKYKDEKISDIVWEQLSQARDDVDSPTAFFNKGVMQDLDTKVSIYSSFKARLAFIRGLLESHRQGTGKRSRLKARQDPSQRDRWEWDLRDSPGTDRDNLRLEYGSLLQNFRVIAMGEDYATRGHGVGTEPNSVKPRYFVWPAVGESNFLTQTFGNLQRVEVWDDIIDKNDLRRRVKQGIKEWSKVGKRLRLAIRVHGIDPYDGYDLTDNVPVDIDRGLVETDRYGSGYWTIWGLEYRVFDDGHDELTWAVKPREDDEDPDPDLIPSDPIHYTPEWFIGNGPPPDCDTSNPLRASDDEPPTAPCDCYFYFDMDSGMAYQRLPDDGYTDWHEKGEWTGTPPGYPGDSTPPDPPTDFSVTALYEEHADGTSEPVFEATWTDAAQSDIIGYEVQWDVSELDPGTGEPQPPDWVSYQSARFGVATNVGHMSPVIGGTFYGFRIRSYDMEGLVSTWVERDPIVAMPDTSAPDIPSNLNVSGGYRMLGCTWGASGASDLGFYQVRYRLLGDTDWDFIEAKASRIIIDSLDSEQDYEVSVRAVDRSGNVRVSGNPDDGTEVIDNVSNKDVGWSETVIGRTLLALPEDIAFDELVANFISTGLLRADQIQGGDLLLGEPGREGTIRIYDAQGRPIGAWGDFGWVIADPENPGRAMWASPQGELRFTGTYDWDGTEDRTTDEYGLVTVTRGIEVGIPTSEWTTAISWEGINAESIRFGSIFGGNNRLLNAGFELVDFDTATLVVKEYTDSNDWGSPTSNVNMDVSGTELRMVVVD